MIRELRQQKKDEADAETAVRFLLLSCSTHAPPHARTHCSPHCSHGGQQQKHSKQAEETLQALRAQLLDREREIKHLKVSFQPHQFYSFSASSLTSFTSLSSCVCRVCVVCRVPRVCVVRSRNSQAGHDKGQQGEHGEGAASVGVVVLRHGPPARPRPGLASRPGIRARWRQRRRAGPAPAAVVARRPPKCARQVSYTQQHRQQQERAPSALSRAEKRHRVQPARPPSTTPSRRKRRRRRKREKRSKENEEKTLFIFILSSTNIHDSNKFVVDSIICSKKRINRTDFCSTRSN